MSYVLSKALETKLTKLLPNVDKGVVRIFAEVGLNSLGEEWLYFRVVLKDDPMLTTPSDALGKRLGKIATALRDRAARLNVPMFASVGFVAESELPRQKRKTA